MTKKETSNKGVDLFEDYESIPSNVQAILDEHAEAFEDGDYAGLQKAHAALKKIGYTFEYGLSGEAYDLRKIGEKGKSEIENKMEHGGQIKYPTDLKVGSILLAKGFTMLKGLNDGNYYKVVEMDNISATFVKCDAVGKQKGTTKVRHKLSSLDGSIKTASRGDNNGLLVHKMAEGGNVQGKNGYVAFYKGKQMDVYADTSLQARDKAAAAFKAKKAYEVTVVLAEKGGTQVTHVAEFAKGGTIETKNFNYTIGGL